LTALRRLPLSLRLRLLSSALMVMVGIVASQQVLSALGRVQDARIRELAQHQVEALSLALGPAVLRADVWEVYDVLDRARQEADGRRVAFSVVADPDGRVLAATDPSRAPIGGAIGETAEGAQSIREIDVRASTGAIQVVAPLVYQGRDVGTVVTELDVSDLAAERRRAVLYLLVGNAVATIALAGARFLATKRMLRPVAKLARYMGDGSGQPTPVHPSEAPRGDGEVAALYRAFNAMTEAVGARAEAERRLAERERFVSLGRLSSSLAHRRSPLG
jgi:hypothetical protein